MGLELSRNAPARLAREMLRPFGPGDLAPVPEGWRIGPPDFVGIGCGKAGSTWWWSLLCGHPQIVPSRVGAKELHYFCHFGWNGPSREEALTYRRAFARPPGGVAGDWSCDYLYYPLAIGHLAACAPEARLVAILRNPVDRCVSAYNMFLQGRARFLDLAAERAYVYRTFSLFPEAVRCCLLADGFRQVLRHYDRDRLLVLQYERCRQDPLRELKRTLAFLGVDAGYAPSVPERRVNALPYAVERPDAAARARLAEVFADDVAALCEMFPVLDRSLWPDFS